MNRAQKAEVIESIRQKADGASIAVITDFKGVTVEEMTDLRAKLREVGVEMQVVKNTLARLAVAGGQHEVLQDKFKENCAVAFGSEDPVACAKVLVEYAKSSKKFDVRLGSLEGSIIDAEGIKALSKLPSKPELLGSALGTMNAVPTNFVCLFANIVRGLLNCLNGVKDQKEAA